MGRDWRPHISKSRRGTKASSLTAPQSFGNRNKPFHAMRDHPSHSMYARAGLPLMVRNRSPSVLSPSLSLALPLERAISGRHVGRDTRSDTRDARDFAARCARAPASNHSIDPRSQQVYSLRVGETFVYSERALCTLEGIVSYPFFRKKCGKRTVDASRELCANRYRVLGVKAGREITTTTRTLVFCGTRCGHSRSEEASYSTTPSRTPTPQSRRCIFFFSLSFYSEPSRFNEPADARRAPRREREREREIRERERARVTGARSSTRSLSRRAATDHTTTSAP